jgi:TRAP-type transport system periplasmic protein
MQSKSALMRVVCAAALLAGGAVVMPAGPAGAADVVLKASHQWPGGRGDVRDEMVQIIAREVAKANVGLKVQVYPGQSLFKAKEQWQAMTKGQLDISAFPLDYASGRHPQFGATLMPGLVKNHEHAARLNKSAFMKDIRKIIDKAGVVVLADAWLAGGFGSKKGCLVKPADLKGLKFRSAGRTFAEMWRAAGASIVPMASSEVYTALQTGVVDATDTSSGSFVSFRLYEQLKCLTAPGKNALWFMYEPVLMSKKSFMKLNKKQQDALMAAGKKSQAFFAGEAKKLDEKLVTTYKKAGVKVVELTPAQAAAWRAVAQKSSYASFARKVPGGKALIEEALAVK